MSVPDSTACPRAKGGLDPLEHFFDFGQPVEDRHRVSENTGGFVKLARPLRFQKPTENVSELSGLRIGHGALTGILAQRDLIELINDRRWIECRDGERHDPTGANLGIEIVQALASSRELTVK